MQPRTAVPPEVRAAVIARDGLVCQLCSCDVVDGGDPNAPDRLNLDHIVQWAMGGPDTVENLRVVCRLCNSKRPRPVPEDQAADRRRYRREAAARRARRRAAAGWSRTPIDVTALAPLTARQRRTMRAGR